MPYRIPDAPPPSSHSAARAEEAARAAIGLERFRFIGVLLRRVGIGFAVCVVGVLALVVLGLLLLRNASLGPPAVLSSYGNLTINGGISRYDGDERVEGLDLWRVCPRGNSRCYVVGVQGDVVTQNPAIFLALRRPMMSADTLARLATRILQNTSLVERPPPRIDGDRLIYVFTEGSGCGEATVTLSTGIFEQTRPNGPCDAR